ncbi:unnamed protein product, partial [Cyprideis torosa]
LGRFYLLYYSFRKVDENAGKEPTEQPIFWVWNRRVVLRCLLTTCPIHTTSPPHPPLLPLCFPYEDGGWNFPKPGDRPKWIDEHGYIIEHLRPVRPKTLEEAWDQESERERMKKEQHDLLHKGVKALMEIKELCGNIGELAGQRLQDGNHPTISTAAATPPLPHIDWTI